MPGGEFRWPWGVGGQDTPIGGSAGGEAGQALGGRDARFPASGFPHGSLPMAPQGPLARLLWNAFGDKTSYSPAFGPAQARQLAQLLRQGGLTGIAASQGVANDRPTLAYTLSGGAQPIRVEGWGDTGFGSLAQQIFALNNLAGNRPAFRQGVRTIRKGMR